MMIYAVLLLFAAAPPEAVKIHAGTFERGSNRAPDEKPIRSVTLKAFGIDVSEVSLERFEQFVREAWNDDTAWGPIGLRWRNAHRGGLGRLLRKAGRRNTHPVVGVSWYEAEAFCAWAGGTLPTEAQWERAACGGQSRLYPFGDTPNDAVRWSTKNSPFEVMKVDTAPANKDPNPSPDGLNHMAGNVWEWTADWYQANAYQDATDTDPTGPKTGRWKSIRGGSFMNLPSYCSCTHREPANPAQARLTLGFRCAYSLD
jgi:formylglycine-generating enzyme required for sulfatase activity